MATLPTLLPELSTPGAIQKCKYCARDKPYYVLVIYVGGEGAFAVHNLTVPTD